MREPRFIKGPAIKDTPEVISLIIQGRWLYWESTPKHPSFLLSMNLRTLDIAARQGRISLALENPERNAT